MADLSDILGGSASILGLREQVRRLLERSSTVRRLPPIVILGETGTGKGLLARTIQRAGPRAGGPFVEVNCAAIPENLLEAEMFGFERGAFTDARQAKPGLFQTAHGGTLFLDEVGLLPELLQGKLLKAIEDRVVRRIGGTRNEPADVWILSATSVDLGAAVREQRFREDLYHRLGVFTLTVPPLRERGADVLLLAEHFLARCAEDYALPPRQLSEDARTALLEHRWPGNVRELANVIERAVLLSDGMRVESEVLGLSAHPAAALRAPGAQQPSSSLEETVGRAEREHLRAALDRMGWNITRTAAELGISRDTLRYRIEKHALRSADESGDARPTKRARRPRVATAVTATSAIGTSEPAAPSPPRRGARWLQRRVALLRVALDAREEHPSMLPAAAEADVVVEKIEGFGGRVEELGAAGLLAVFGLDLIEEPVQRAAHAALAIRNAVARASTAGARTIDCRIAIHAGPLLVGEGSRGSAIDLQAKRDAWQATEELVAATERGAIVVSDGAVPSLLRLFELVPLEPDVPRARRVYRLTGREQSEVETERQLAPFVGRQREMDLLLDAFRSSAAGRGRSLGIAGEAGIGKSRLVTELRRRLPSGPVEWLHARCFSHGAGTPYLPLRMAVRQALGIAEADERSGLASRVRRGLEDTGLDGRTLVAPLLQLLGAANSPDELAGLSAEALRNRIFDALLSFHIGRSRRSPLVLVVEDVHWVDRSSEAWLGLLTEHVARASILFVSTYRPGYRPSWMARSDATQIALQPLDRSESRAVIEPLLSAQIAASLGDRILDRAEGNPFFLEELARNVGEHRGEGAGDPVPITVQEVLQARIDRLDDGPRQLLDAAAVVGRAAPATLLRALWDGSGPPDPHLRELSRLEFLYEDGRGDSMAHVFQHALVHEVTYQALPPGRRQALHAAAATALETLYPERLDDVADRLAYHCSRADLGDKAVAYLSRVAEKSAAIYAHAEAVAALRQALAHVERGALADRDRRALALVLRQAESLYFLGGFVDLVALLAEHRERLGRLDDPSLAAPYHFWLASAWSLLGNPPLIVEHGRQALAEAARNGDVGMTGKALHTLAYECFWSGRPAEGIAHARDAIVHLERADERVWLGHAHWLLAVNHLLAGEFEVALEAVRRSCAIGDLLGDQRLRSIGSATIGACYALMGEYELGIETCREGLALSRDPVNTAIATAFLGAVFLEKGEFTDAIPLLEHAVELYTRMGVRQTAGWFTAMLAEARLLGGASGEAQELAQHALEVLGITEYRYGIAWAERALGRIALARQDLADAERWLGRALATFSSIDARYEVARTHLHLARLAHVGNRLGQASQHLREALSSFETLGLPRYSDRCRKLAVELDLGGV